MSGELLWEEGKRLNKLYPSKGDTENSSGVGHEGMRCEEEDGENTSENFLLMTSAAASAERKLGKQNYKGILRIFTLKNTKYNPNVNRFHHQFSFCFNKFIVNFSFKMAINIKIIRVICVPATIY